jgi:hypothetical protein
MIGRTTKINMTIQGLMTEPPASTEVSTLIGYRPHLVAVAIQIVQTVHHYGAENAFQRLQIIATRT